MSVLHVEVDGLTPSILSEVGWQDLQGRWRPDMRQYTYIQSYTQYIYIDIHMYTCFTSSKYFNNFRSDALDKDDKVQSAPAG